MSVQAGGERSIMEIRNSALRYGAVAQALHWSMAALILVQVVAGFVLEELPRKTALRSFAFDAHESVGLALLALVALRLAWRLAGPVPEESGPRWQHYAARIAHALLYALMIAVPLVGYAMVDAKGYDVAFFGATGPDVLATDETLAQRLDRMHLVLAVALAALVALHVAAAVWHRFVLHDSVLSRMLPRSGGPAGAAG
jgi:cytochrome b561